MTISADEQLRQLQAQAASRQQTSSLGQYQKQLETRPSMSQGMLNIPQREMPIYSEKDFSYFKTAQPQQPESGGMSVMCTLMREYGYLENDVFDADTLFGHLIATTHPEILIGYHAWAKPLTEFLRNNAIYIPLFAYIVQAWAYEMAEQFGIVKNRSTFKRLVGKIVMNVGKPVCGFIGTVISSSQGNYEYHRT
jgi:hypothetical protein